MRDDGEVPVLDATSLDVLPVASGPWLPLPPAGLSLNNRDLPATAKRIVGIALAPVPPCPLLIFSPEHREQCHVASSPRHRPSAVSFSCTHPRSHLVTRSHVGRVPNSLITCDLHLRSMTLRVWDVWYNIYDI